MYVCDLSHAKGSGKWSPPIPEGAGGNPIAIGKAGKNPNTIRGNCTVIDKTKPSASARTESSEPCVDIVISLTDEKGSEISRTRTTSKGAFRFVADQTKTYRVSAVSPQYELVSQNPVIHGGDNIDIQLQEK